MSKYIHYVVLTFFFSMALASSANADCSETIPGSTRYHLSDYDEWRSIVAPNFFCKDELAKWSLEENVYLDILPNGSGHLHGVGKVVYGDCGHYGERWYLDIYLQVADELMIAPRLQPHQTAESAVDWNYWWVSPDSKISHLHGSEWAQITNNPVTMEHGFQLGQGANIKNDNLGGAFLFDYIHYDDDTLLNEGLGELNSNAHLLCEPDCLSNEDCDDDQFCNGVELCIDYMCTSDNKPCDVFCNEDNDSCYGCQSSVDCDDGKYCNGYEVCNHGQCNNGPPPCSEEDNCNEDENHCEAKCNTVPNDFECETDSDCSDNYFCNGVETCYKGRCVLGHWPCYSQLCDEEYDTCVRRPELEYSDGGTNHDGGDNSRPGFDAGTEPETNMPAEDDDVVLSGSSVWSALGCNNTNSFSFYAAFVLLGFILLFRKRNWISVVALVFFVSPVAQASSSHFDLAPGPNNYWVTNNPVVLDHATTSGWLVADYANRPLVLRTLNGNPVQNILDSQTSLQLGASLGLFDIFEFGVAAKGSYLHGTDFNGSSIRHLGVGDPTLMGKLRLTPWKYGLVAALRLEGNLPLSRLNGNPVVASLMGDVYPTLTPALNLGLEFDIFRVALDVGQTIRHPVLIGPEVVGTTTNISAGAELELIPNVWSLTGDVFTVVSHPLFNVPFLPPTNRWAAPTEGVLGTKVNLGPVAISWGLGTGFIQDYGTPDVRVFAGVGWNPPKPKVIEQKECDCEELEPVKNPTPVLTSEKTKTIVRTKSTVVILKPDRIQVLEPIHFEFDSDVIKPESFELLNAIIDTINSHPELKRLSIEGHTDSVGSTKYNQDLSERRAASVKNYFVENGVSKDILTTKGFGELRPLVDNDSEANRAINRRVEFIITERVPEEKTTVEKVETQ